MYISAVAMPLEAITCFQIFWGNLTMQSLHLHPDQMLGCEKFTVRCMHKLTSKIVSHALHTVILEYFNIKE